jgi:ABC-type phosphate transport system permease subunit
MHQHALFALGVILFIIVAVLNAITTALIGKGIRKGKGCR